LETARNNRESNSRAGANVAVFRLGTGLVATSCPARGARVRGHYAVTERELSRSSVCLRTKVARVRLKIALGRVFAHGGL